MTLQWKRLQMQTTTLKPTQLIRLNTAAMAKPASKTCIWTLAPTSSLAYSADALSHSHEPPSGLNGILMFCYQKSPQPPSACSPQPEPRLLSVVSHSSPRPQLPQSDVDKRQLLWWRVGAIDAVGSNQRRFIDKWADNQTYGGGDFQHWVLQNIWTQGLQWRTLRCREAEESGLKTGREPLGLEKGDSLDSLYHATP